MTRRFFLSILLLVFAFGLQFLLSGSGIFISIIFAALITFSFFFDLFELIVFILLAIFVINWQPVISWEIVLFAIVPIVAYGIRNISSWHRWAVNLLSIFFGVIIFYFIFAPGSIWSNPAQFATDLLGSMIFGQILFSVLSHYAPQ